MKQVNRDDLLNWWLMKYHNTNVEEVVEKYPKEVLNSSEWFKLFPVTQEQHDEWVAWAKDHIKKVTKISKAMVERQWGYIYLDCSPYVKREEDGNK
jgi:hypothetical protein